jgi:hypothetical protein
MYMCDKPGPQAKLAEQLAQPLLLILENPKLKSKTARLQAALSYLSVFWITIVREWSSIDKHRWVAAVLRAYVIAELTLRCGSPGRTSTTP